MKSLEELKEALAKRNKEHSARLASQEKELTKREPEVRRFHTSSEKKIKHHQKELAVGRKKHEALEKKKRAMAQKVDPHWEMADRPHLTRGHEIAHEK